MEPDFPIEFVVHGIPVSWQAASAPAKEQWKQRVKEASLSALPEMHAFTDKRLAVTLYYFPADEMDRDIDNIIKLPLDALNRHVYRDDKQVDRIVVQRFDVGTIVSFGSPSDVLLRCLAGSKPALYMRIADNPTEGL